MIDKKQKAQMSEALLANPVLQEGFDVVLGYHTGVFTQVSATEAQVLEARRMALALNEVKNQLHRYIATGQIIKKRDQDRAND
jgi:hypothetical protein